MSETVSGFNCPDTVSNSFLTPLPLPCRNGSCLLCPCRFLRNVPSCLKPGGHIAILSFHSGEDRRVKLAFKQGLRDAVYASISPEVIRPSPAEQRANPRSSPAKLRSAVRS